MRGLFWADPYHPNDFFATAKLDDDERYFEAPSMTEERKEAILWLACQISKAGWCLTYRNQQFEVVAAHDVEIGPPAWAMRGDDLILERAESPSALSVDATSHTAADDLTTSNR